MAGGWRRSTPFSTPFFGFQKICLENDVLEWFLLAAEIKGIIPHKSTL